MTPISICFIAKNEEKNIEKCLSPFQTLDMEIIVVDTGSTDQTVQSASRYTSHIYPYIWTNDFSAARNFAVSKATNDWILVIDFDEHLEQLDMPGIISLLSKYPTGIGTITRRNPCRLLSGQSSVMTEQVARLFNRKYHHYEGIIHEQVLPIDSTTPTYFAVPASFYHHGYDEPSILGQKAERNLILLLDALQKQPNDPYLLYQTGKCYQVKKDYATACQYFDAGLSTNIDPALSYVQDMIEAYGYCLLEHKDYETALGLSGVYDLFNQNADFVFLMGLIYMNNALFEQAIVEFQKAASMSYAKVEGINSYLANYNIGVIYECQGQKQQAIYFYKKCGNYVPALERLAQM